MRHFEAAFARLADEHRAPRARHFEAFRSRGLPDTDQEEWRYTDLAPLAARPFALARRWTPELVAPALGAALEGAQTLAFANGVPVRGDYSLVGDGSAGDVPDGVSALNASFAVSGLQLDVPPGAQRVPFHLYTWFGGQADGMAHLRHRVRLGANAATTLVIHEYGDEAPFLATQVFDVELGPGARLVVYRLQHYGASTTALTRMDLRLAADSHLQMVGLHAGGALTRSDVNVALQRGAEARVSGVLAPAGTEHLDVHTRIEHHGAHATSRENFRVLVQDRARAVFNGKVVVHPGAAKTDSEQHVDSLLLSPGAEVNAKPELEIYADDVKCAHGATCGQLDEAQLFYLRARGIPAGAARGLLLQAFASRILRDIGLDPVRRHAEQALLERLPGAVA